jgi:phosphatidylinositol glycan class K
LQGEGKNETQWKEELAAIDKMILDARRKHNESINVKPRAQHVVEEAKPVQSVRREGAVKVDDEQGWSKQVVGAATLLGCAGVWLAGSLFESM